ncbi:KaiA family protein [Nostocaceae cyanobacterium CENA357]|uniref:Circadian clock oscillator protein KaiA n=1 Tax=Atlanticothrix silvestris CENA357 TaxID=1725252 RepID=A0A8J7H9E5_9CYAN|nr:circadian clock protein KaiA [Atlanticothrix silvestris]MBH8551986.1 KaiA family protein [Atlanticothrix silvestris CENA357]
MLLPVLIFQPDVKKNLDCPTRLAIQAQSSKEQIWNFSKYAIEQLNLLPFITTTTKKIHYLIRCLKTDLSENFSDQYLYVFACQEQIPKQVFQRMTQVDQQVLLRQLKSDYREILINYFTTDTTLKEKIDKFINAVFCANIPVPQIIEIHMDLIEEFSKHLKLEGRSDETLLDYRLTLIDVLAHLCEVYRCSTSR